MQKRSKLSHLTPKLPRKGIPLVMLAAAVAGCPSAPTQPGAPAFSISLASTPAPVAPGDDGAVDLLVTPTSGYNGDITVNLQVQATSLTASDQTFPAGQNTLHVVFHVPNTATTGVKLLPLHARGTGSAEAYLTVSINVVAPGTYGITASTTNAQLVPGGPAATPTITVLRSNFTGPVTLTATSLSPTQVTVSPASTVVTTNPVTFSIAAVSSAPDGTYTVSIDAHGTGAADQHLTITVEVTRPSYSLQVTAPPSGVVAGTSGQVTVTATRDAGFTAPIGLTATSTNGITIAPASITATQTTMQVTVPGGVPAGQYNAIVTASAPGLTDKTVTVPFQVVVAATYTMAVQTAPLNVVLGSGAQNVLNITRNGFAPTISISATADQGTSTAVDPGITITPNPVSTLGSSSALAVVVGAGVYAGTHSATVTGTSAGIANVVATFAIVTSFPTDGSQAPTGIVITTAPAATAGATPIGSTRQYTAYLVDAQGNRTLPAAGFNVGFAVTNSNFGTLQPLPAYDVAQRWRIATVMGGPLAGSTTVTAFYFNTTTGTSTFTASAPLVSQ